MKIRLDGEDFYDEWIRPMPPPFRRGLIVSLLGMVVGSMGMVVAFQLSDIENLTRPMRLLLELMLMLTVVHLLRGLYFFFAGDSWRFLVIRKKPVLTWEVPSTLYRAMLERGRWKWREGLHVQAFVLLLLVVGHGCWVLVKTPGWEEFRFWHEVKQVLLLWGFNWALWHMGSGILKGGGNDVPQGRGMVHVSAYEAGLLLPGKVLLWQFLGGSTLLKVRWEGQAEEGWWLLRIWTLLGVIYLPVPVGEAEEVQAYFEKRK